MDLESGIDQFLSFLTRFEDSETQERFMDWLSSNMKELRPAAREEFLLQEIASEIRELLPLDAQLGSERIQPSSVGPNSDCTEENTIHVDAFLYNDDMVDNLVEEGKISRAYCKKCGSKDTAPLNFISHSASIPQLKAIFHDILPDLTGKLVLDVGSRLGAVLYGAHYFSKASKIVGIELNADLVQIQQRVISGKGLSGRIEVVNGDICLRQDLLKAANVIIFNNVFEFFAPQELQTEVWMFLRREILPGTLLVTIPSLEDTIGPLKTGIELASWVREVSPCRISTIDEDEESETSEVKLYEVL